MTLVRYELEAAQADALVELGPWDQDCRRLLIRISSVLVFLGSIGALDILRRALIEFVAHLQLGADRPPGLLIDVIGSAGVGRARVRLGTHRNSRTGFAVVRTTGSGRGRNRHTRCNQ